MAKAIAVAVAMALAELTNRKSDTINTNKNYIYRTSVPKAFRSSEVEKKPQEYRSIISHPG